MHTIIALLSLLFISQIWPSVALELNHGSVNLNGSARECTLKSPPPANTTCGIRGTVEPGCCPQSTAPAFAKSAAECVLFCVRCASLAYDPDSGVCMQYFYRAERLDFNESADGSFILYSKDCFECSPACPHQSSRANLFFNPGFENSASLYGPWYSFHDVPQIGKGYHSPDAIYAQGSLCQDVELCQNTKYCWSFDYKPVPSKDADESRFILLANAWRPGGFDGTGDILYYDYLSKSEIGTWLHYFWTFTAEADYTKNFKYSGLFALDNAKLYPCSPTFERVGSNLISNGGFESGELAPWALYYQDYISDSVPEHRNIASPGLRETSKYKFSFRQHIANGSIGPGYFYTYYDYNAAVEISQDVVTEAGQYYEFSFDYKSVILAGETPNELHYAKADGLSWDVSPTENHNTVQHFSELFRARRNLTRISITLDSELRKNTTQRTDFDNIRVIKIRNLKTY